MKTTTHVHTSTRLTSRVRQRASIFIAALFCFAFLSSFALAQNVTVSGSTGADASYATLKDAFDALNANTTQTGNTISVSIVGDTTETASASLNQPSGGSWTSLTISPSGGAARTIGGNLALPLVVLNGADNVTIDGLNAGGNALTISNTNATATAGTSTIKFINDATNNTVTNCSVLGSFTGSVTTPVDGGNIWFSTGPTTGNDANTISNCNIGPAGANLPSRLIYGLGTTATTPPNNSGVIINNNNLFDFFVATLGSRAIDIAGGNTDWTISNNKIYQTATRTWTTGAEMRGISINNSTSANNMQVTGNTIGFASAAGTGTFTITGGANTFKGIHLVVAATTASNIQNNIVANISQTTTTAGTSTSAAFMALYPQTGLITTTGNTIGSLTGTGSISFSSSSTSTGEVDGIFNFSSQNSLINNNNIGSITATNTSTGSIVLQAIRTDLISSVTATVSGNTIGGTTANSINNTATATSSRVIGWNHITGISSCTGNTIRNMTMSAGNTGTGQSASVVGILQAVTTNTTISQNTVFNLSNTNATANVVVVGATFLGGTSNTFSKNLIYDLSVASSGTSAGVDGLVIGTSSSGATVGVFNNLIGNLTAPASANSTAAIRGIAMISTATTTNLNLSYNTVYLNGSSTGANFGTSGILHTTSATSTTAALNLRDNVIVNISTPAGTGLTVAYRRSSTTLTNYGSVSNNNDFYAGAPSTSRLIFNDGTNSDQTISAYKTRVASRDSASISENPPFLSTTSGNANFLHIDTTVATQLESGGIPITGITDDFDGDARNASTPDIGADEFTGILLDLTPPTISYATLGNSIVAGTRSFNNVTVTDGSGVNIASGTRPRVYYKRATDANSFGDNTSATNGWKFVEANGAGGSPFSFTIDYSLLFGGSGVTVGDSIQYFVVAQDLAATPNVGINSGTFAAQPSSVALTAAAFPIGGTINSYNIVATISGAKTVGGGGTPDYATLTGAGGAFADINAKVVSGNIVITVAGDLTEDGTNALNELAETGVGSYTVTIQSDSATVRTISGSVAAGMIRLNGADRVTFDGRVGGSGQFLRFRNTNTGGPTFLLSNDATNNTIESCLVESGNTSTTSGTIVFSTSTGTLGNSGNTIHLCDIRDRSDATGVPANGVYSSGSSGAPNGTNTISGCNVFNWTNAGVFVTSTGAGNGWVVNPSSFYQTAARTTAMTGISIQGGSGHSILSNSIGGMAPGASGSFLATSSTFRGIDLTVGTVSPTSVQGNVVKNIRSTSTSFTASYGIFLQAGTANIGNVTPNSVGSAVVAERYEINGDSYAIRAASTSMVNLSNNIVNNMTTSPTVPLGEFYFGISVEGTGGSHTVVNNTVTNFTNTSTPGGGFDTQTIAMIVSATGVQTVRGNTLTNSGCTSTTAPTALNNRVWGMVVSGTGVGSVVEKNLISNIFAAGGGVGARADIVTCLQSQTVANATFSNNMVSTNGGTAGTSDRAIFGILDLSASPAISNYYFNSVNITGTATAANNTYAFNRNSTATVTLRDNIFVDTRSGGTGLHVAMANTNAAATGWSASASDYNALFNAAPANLTQWLGSAAGNNQTLAGFQSASGGDSNSINADPLFVSASDLHIQSASPAKDTGISFGGIVTDIDGDARPQLAGFDRGADEIPNTAPSVTAAAGVTRQQGSPASNSTIATVNDAETGAGSVTVTVTSANPSNGVTISNIVNTAGTVTADVVASCTATNATFTLQASDGSLMSSDTLSVTVTPDVAPTLSYNNDMVAFNGSTMINPATGPSDNGSVSTIAVQSTGTYTGMISVDNTTGVVSISNAAPTGTHTITIRATDNCGLTTDAMFTLTVPNTAPSIAATAGVTRQQGSPASNSTIAMVNDAESGAGAVTVTVTSANPSNGVTISNIVNNAGTVTADVVADCNATNATFTLQASDGSLMSMDTLSVTVTPDVAPTLSYSNDSVAYNGSTMINPATGPSDNGSVSTIAVQSQGTYTGMISVDNTTGVVSFSNAKPAGMHTITIRATDNCGLTTDAMFTLTVGAPSSNADLSNLTLSDGTLTPAFDSNTTSYTASVPNSTSSMTVTPTAADANATIEVRVNGGMYSPVASGSPSGPLALNVGANTIDVKVAAQDETGPARIHAPATTKIYTVTVTRASGASNNADLADLTASAGPLSPAFDPNTTSYTINVPFTTTSTTVTPTAADAGATIIVNPGNMSVPSGSPSSPIALAVGNNMITVEVTAADTTTMKTYTINVIRGGQVVVSGSTGADGSYTTLKLAFDAINANGTQGGNTISVSLLGDTAETAAAVLNQPATSSWTSLTITPSGARTVTTSAGGGLATPLVDLAGADNVTIDGLNASGNSLTISNPSTAATAGTSTIRFINGATNNTVTRCTILGSSTGAVTAATGNVLFSTSTVAGGNSNNAISNNNIGPAGANLPTSGVKGVGGTNANNLNLIDNNNIFDFFNATVGPAGVSVQGTNTNWTVSNNRLYQTATRTFTGAAGIRYTGILVSSSGNTHTISGNTIGFASSAGTGTTTITGTGTGLGNEFRGIAFTASSTTVFSSIQGNVISGINQTTNRASTTTDLSAFIGIQTGTSTVDSPANIGDMTGNRIGSLDGSSTIVVNDSSTTASLPPLMGILDFNFQTGISVSNNQIGSITINQNAGAGTTLGFRGILVAGTTGTTHTVNNNTIGSAAGPIVDNLAGNYAMYAIQCGSTSVTATGNTARNITGNATSSAGTIVVGGIVSSASTLANTFSQNTIHSFHNNSGATGNFIFGIFCSFPAAANVVERNFVHSFSMSTTVTTGGFVGIAHQAGTGTTYRNNMVRLGLAADGSSVTTGFSIVGMRDISTNSSNFYYNSVYVGGTGVASAVNTFAFQSTATAGTRNFVDNIFWNARDNASGAGKNYAITVAGTAPNPAGLTSNYNDLYATGTGGFVGLFNSLDQLTLANWQTATGQDANSISQNPSFVNPTGTAATVDLHIDCNSRADGAGTPIAGITTDFDNETRDATTPDIGADEINLGNPPALVSAASRKVHGAAGPFDIALPLVGPAGIEPRSGGATGDYQVVFTFNTPVTTSGAIVSSGTGMVSMVSAVGNTIVVDLTGVTDNQVITVKLLCVFDNVNLGSVSASMRLLIGDVDQSGAVNSTDVSTVKFNVGSVVDGTTFRTDVNANGAINSTDVNITKQHVP